MRNSCCLLALYLATTACAGGDTARQTIRNRAGDTTIVRTVGADSLRTVLALNEELAIGTVAGEDAYTFGEITLMAVTADGTIYAYDRQVPALRVYTGEGRYLRDIGSSGSGPGEYRMAQGLAVAPDGRVLLYDPANARVNVYDADGDPSGEWRFMSGLPPLILGAFIAQALTVDSAGRVYITTAAGPPGVDGSWEFVAVRHTAEGTLLDTIWPPRFDFERPLLVVEARGRRSFMAPPYTPGALWTITRSGGLASTFSGEYRISIAQPVGGVLRLEKEQAPVAIEEEERRVREEDIVAIMRRSDPSWRWSGPAFPRQKPFIRPYDDCTRLTTAGSGYCCISQAFAASPRRRTGPAGGSASPSLPLTMYTSRTAHISGEWRYPSAPRSW